MENKELKQTIPEELKDEQLKAVAGGSTTPDHALRVKQPYVIEPTVIEPYRPDPPVRIQVTSLDMAKPENEVKIDLETPPCHSLVP